MAEVSQLILSIELYEPKFWNLDAHFFAKLMQSLMYIELHITKLCTFDAKNNLCTDGLWSKLAI